MEKDCTPLEGYRSLGEQKIDNYANSNTGGKNYKSKNDCSGGKNAYGKNAGGKSSDQWQQWWEAQQGWGAGSSNDSLGPATATRTGRRSKDGVKVGSTKK